MGVPLDVVCSRRLWCGTCRDKEGGRAWRADLAAYVVLPADAPDFACSHGGGWGRPPAAQIAAQTAGPTASAAGRWALQGPALWAELHRAALAGTMTRGWLADFSNRIPCGECRAHWLAYLAEHPPDDADTFEWAWAAHQAVNDRLGKPGISLEAARRVYPSPATTTQ